jgi:DNA polymerase/3'-5' exonuclease PolX
MKTKRPYYIVKDIADQLIEKFNEKNAVTRIEIAGSLRRREQEVGDIELIAIPRPVVNLFGEATGATYVDITLQEWGVELRKNGKKYKQFEFATAQGHWYQVDLFLQPDPATWGVNMLLRTGPDDFSARMVTPRSKRGFMPDSLRVQGARVWRGSELLNTPDEQALFDLWEMGFVEPQKRASMGWRGAR